MADFSNTEIAIAIAIDTVTDMEIDTEIDFFSIYPISFVNFTYKFVRY